MKEILTGIVCCVPYTMYLLTIMMCKKYNDIRSPTIFYMKNNEHNNEFYKPLLDDEKEMLNNEKKLLNNEKEMLNNEKEMLDDDLME